jgi:predicted RNase H-like HicB family nuclease
VNCEPDPRERGLAVKANGKERVTPFWPAPAPYGRAEPVNAARTAPERAEHLADEHWPDAGNTGSMAPVRQASGIPLPPRPSAAAQNHPPSVATHPSGSVDASAPIGSNPDCAAAFWAIFVQAELASGRIVIDLMVEIQPLQVESEREEDGRYLASVPQLPGVMAYGDTQESALRKAKSIALQVLADMMESGEELPEPLRVLFAA